MSVECELMHLVAVHRGEGGVQPASTVSAETDNSLVEVLLRVPLPVLQVVVVEGLVASGDPLGPGDLEPHLSNPQIELVILPPPPPEHVGEPVGQSVVPVGQLYHSPEELLVVVYGVQVRTGQVHRPGSGVPVADVVVEGE